MRLVILESPFAGAIEINIAYARAAMSDCFGRGEAPFASHLLYTQPGVLDDSLSAERELGIGAGLRWGELAAATVVYTDLGISKGMEQGIAAAQQSGRPIEYRTLAGGAWPLKVFRHGNSMGRAKCQSIQTLTATVIHSALRTSP